MNSPDERRLRRSLLLIPLIVLVVVAALACGTDAAEPTSTATTTPATASPTPGLTPGPTASPTTQAATPTTAPTAGATATAAAPAFPVTIEHKFGSTTITEKPERVVVVGLVEQDALLALGVVPVATREWYGGRPGAIFPWAEDLVGDAPMPEVMEGDLDFEKIAALKPDLIIGLYSALTQDEYDTLSQIAPTVAQPGEYIDWGIPWDELTITVGKVLGEESEARALVADVEAKFAAAREAHPEFEGATGAIASTWGFPQTYYPYASQDPRGRFMAALGFQVPPEIDELAGGEYGASVSMEQIDLVDVDVLVWVDGSIDTPLYNQLDVHTQGRDITLTADNPLYDALNFSTVLSLPFAIDGMVPQLAAAIDGDPETTAGG